MAVTTASRPTQNRRIAEGGIGTVTAAVANTVAVKENAPAIFTSEFTLTGLPVTVVDAGTDGAWGGTLFYTFPAGRIIILGSVCNLTFTTTSVLANTLNLSKANVEFGIGTAVAAAVLATTAMNVNPGTGITTAKFTSSAAINVASAEVTSALSVSSTAQFDGTTTPITLYLNIGVTAANNADIDGDATVTVAGTIKVTWMTVGDY